MWSSVWAVQFLYSLLYVSMYNDYVQLCNFEHDFNELRLYNIILSIDLNLLTCKFSFTVTCTIGTVTSWAGLFVYVKAELPREISQKHFTKFYFGRLPCEILFREMFLGNFAWKFYFSLMQERPIKLEWLFYVGIIHNVRRI